MKNLINFPENIKDKKVLIISEDCLLSEGFLSSAVEFKADVTISNFQNFKSIWNELVKTKWDIIIFHPFSLDIDFNDKNIETSIVENYIKIFFLDFVPSLINKCSVMSLLPLDFYNSYSNRTTISSLCGFIHGYVKSLSIELASKSIKTNSAILGYIEGDRVFSYESTFNSNKNRSPIQRAPEISELILPVLFLASDSADFATGSSYAIDGGWSSTWGFDTTVKYPTD